MAFCPSCGSPVEGRFCGKCGSAVDAAAPAAPAPGMQASAVPAAGGMSENVAGALCYVLGLITGILFLVLAPYNQNKTVRFHAFQSIFLNVAWIGVWIVLSIISTVASSIFWGLGMLMGLLNLIVALGFLVVWVMMLVKTYSGQKMVLPVIGPLAEKQA